MSNNKVAMAAAMAGGYLLGRTKKAKLALAVGSYLAGRRFGLSPGQMLSEGLEKLQQTPQFQELSDQVRGELLTAGRTAVTNAANRRLTDFADALRDRTDELTGAGRRDEDDKEYGDRDGEYKRDDDYDKRGDRGRRGYDDEYGGRGYDDDSDGFEAEGEDDESASALPRKAARKSAARRTPAKKKAPPARRGAAKSTGRGGRRG
ncbi:hypothetical protein AB0I82_14190 [Streptomyces sp. NPDC050315]|uniref:hypothetical protein n=1 Tax=Streptomyces sp. NPDC050315 TaxID=3155039 RepID=UPI003420A76A